MKFTDAPTWFFAWVAETPYITVVCGWSRKQVIEEVVRSNQMEWRKIYQRGGRVIRCNVQPVAKGKSK